MAHAGFRDRLAKCDVPCLQCGYNLRGCEGDACPECGTRITEQTLSGERERLKLPLSILIWAVCIVGVVALVLPALERTRVTVRGPHPERRIRGIHMGMVMYAQTNGNWFPGLDAKGVPVDATVEGRLELLLQGNYFTAEHLVHPDDPQATIWSGGIFSSADYSYALLSVDSPGRRRAEWRDTLNPDAVAVSDRFLGTAAQPLAMKRRGWSRAWQGEVVFNDNHVETVDSPILPTVYSGVANPQDDLFQAAGTDDALLIHSGK